MNANELACLARQRLSEKRFKHVEGVAKTAQALALQYGADPEKACIAGWLHDLERETPHSQAAAAARAAGIEDESLYKNAMLLHGPLASCRARAEWGIEDEEVLQAEYAHTLGDDTMALFTCVLYLADGIEPGRSYPGVEQLRKTAQEDLYLAVEQALLGSMEHLQNSGKTPHPQSARALERIRAIRKEAKQ